MYSTQERSRVVGNGGVPRGPSWGSEKGVMGQQPTLMPGGLGLGTQARAKLKKPLEPQAGRRGPSAPLPRNSRAPAAPSAGAPRRAEPAARRSAGVRDGGLCEKRQSQGGALKVGPSRGSTWSVTRETRPGLGSSHTPPQRAPLQGRRAPCGGRRSKQGAARAPNVAPTRRALPKPTAARFGSKRLVGIGDLARSGHAPGGTPPAAIGTAALSNTGEGARPAAGTGCCPPLTGA